MSSQRTLCIPVSALGISLSTLSLSQSIMLILLLCYGFWKSLKFETAKLFIIIYWITCLTLLIAGTSFPIHQMFNFEFFTYCDDLNRISITATISLVSYMISLVAICCLYLVRLILAFKDSEFSMSKYVLILFIFGLLIQFTLLIASVYVDVKLWWAFNQKNYQILCQIYIAFGIIIIIYNILLLISFSRKMYLLNRKINTLPQDLITQTVIHTLCLFWSFCFTLAAFIFSWIRVSLFTDTNELYMVHLTLISLDIFMNSLCVHLQFKHSQKFCHKCCKCFIKKIENKRKMAVNKWEDMIVEKQNKKSAVEMITISDSTTTNNSVVTLLTTSLL